MAAEQALKPEARPKTETEQVADYYYALHLQREAEAKAAEQAKIAARAERAAVDALKKKLVDDCGFSADAAERRARELRRKKL
jgi:hypothetical protein